MTGTTAVVVFFVGVLLGAGLTLVLDRRQPTARCRVHRRRPLTVQTTAVMTTPRPTPTTSAASAKTAVFMVSPAVD